VFIIIYVIFIEIPVYREKDIINMVEFPAILLIATKEYIEKDVQ
jgi:hypothetical protein